jgi:hypothetical protein
MADDAVSTTAQTGVPAAICRRREDIARPLYFARRCRARAIISGSRSKTRALRRASRISTPPRPSQLQHLLPESFQWADEERVRFAAAMLRESLFIKANSSH